MTIAFVCSFDDWDWLSDVFCPFRQSHPHLEEELKELRKHLVESTNEMAPLKVWQLQGNLPLIDLSLWSVLGKSEKYPQCKFVISCLITNWSHPCFGSSSVTSAQSILVTTKLFTRANVFGSDARFVSSIYWNFAGTQSQQILADLKCI